MPVDLIISLTRTPQNSQPRVRLRGAGARRTRGNCVFLVKKRYLIFDIQSTRTCCGAVLHERNFSYCCASAAARVGQRNEDTERSAETGTIDWMCVAKKTMIRMQLGS